VPIENAPLSVSTTDYHTAGEPFRIVSGVGPIPGKTVLDKREWAIENLDHVRRLLVYEPRGHADMYGCFVTEPDDEDGGLGVLFFHNEGFSTACGHGTIALAIWAIESGVFAPSEPETQMVIDVPSGRLPVVVQVVDGFVPDFLLGEDPEEVKRGLKRSLRRLLDQRFDNLLFAHGVPLVGGGKEALGAFLEQGHHYSGSQCS
jgi:proline racemase